MNMYHSAVSVSSTLIVVVLVRQFQPNYLIIFWSIFWSIFKNLLVSKVYRIIEF